MVDRSGWGSVLSCRASVGVNCEDSSSGLLRVQKSLPFQMHLDEYPQRESLKNIQKHDRVSKGTRHKHSPLVSIFEIPCFGFLH